MRTAFYSTPFYGPMDKIWENRNAQWKAKNRPKKSGGVPLDRRDVTTTYFQS